MWLPWPRTLKPESRTLLAVGPVKPSPKLGVARPTEVDLVLGPAARFRPLKGMVGVVQRPREQVRLLLATDPRFQSS
jgi:hypothetical protein